MAEQEKMYTNEFQLNNNSIEGLGTSFEIPKTTTADVYVLQDNETSALFVDHKYDNGVGTKIILAYDAKDLTKPVILSHAPIDPHTPAEYRMDQPIEMILGDKPVPKEHLGDLEAATLQDAYKILSQYTPQMQEKQEDMTATGGPQINYQGLVAKLEEHATRNYTKESADKMADAIAPYLTRIIDA